MQPIERFRPWYQKPAPWIAVALLGCGGFLALPHAHRAYYRWTEVRKVQRATAAFERGDYKEAALNAQGALATDAKHVEATRMMAKICEAVGSPETLKYRRQLDAIKPGDPENLIGMADHCLKKGDVSAARQALQSISEADRTGARYHDVAAGVAWTQQDLVAAEMHSTEAVRLVPADEAFQMRLATLRLNGKSPELRAEALQTLQQLSDKASARSRALRTLLNDALARGETERALDVAASLSTSADATFADKLAHLTAMHAIRAHEAQSKTASPTVKEEQFTALFGQLQQSAQSRPEELYQMISWMNEHHMALLVPEWVDTLPAETITKPPVCIAVADALARGSAWARLRDTVEKASWEKLDHLRHAYLSRALEGLDDDGGASTAWNRAIESAQTQPSALELLARETMKWGWKQRSEELLWKLTARPPSPRWAVDALWASGLKRQDPAMLFKVSKLILEAEPKNMVVRNHFISLALLTGQESEGPHALAEAHYKEHPDNVGVASTYGFSLFQQGRSEEAVAVMATFPKEQLRSPALAFYQGIFLAGAGRPEEGEEFFKLGAGAVQFEELIAIRGFLRAAFDAHSAERDGKPTESAAAWQTAVRAAQARPQWLEILGRIALKWGWVERAGEAAMKLADAGRCPSWAVEPLWAASLRVGDPAQIHKASKLILEANSQSLTARANFILVSLLAGKEADAPHRLAAALLQEHPGQSEAVAASAYSLYLQGKGASGLAQLRALKQEQLQQVRPALYYSLLLAAAGEPDPAALAIAPVTDATLLPEEKTMCNALRFAFDSRTADRASNAAAASTAWSKAIAQAEKRPDLLETLGRMAQKWESPERAEEALWKLVDLPTCPRWVLDLLAASADKRRDAGQLYRVHRMLRRAEPQNIAFRNNHIWLSLLTAQDAESPNRAARELQQEHPRNPEVAVTYALSLHQQDKTADAIAVLAALPPEQLRAGRAALYYGIFLSAAGQEAKAREYLQIGSQTPLLPEEQKLLTKAEKLRASNTAR